MAAGLKNPLLRPFHIFPNLIEGFGNVLDYIVLFRLLVHLVQLFVVKRLVDEFDDIPKQPRVGFVGCGGDRTCSYQRLFLNFSRRKEDFVVFPFEVDGEVSVKTSFAHHKDYPSNKFGRSNNKWKPYYNGISEFFKVKRTTFYKFFTSI